MKVIAKILKPINKHDPKASKVYVPSETLDYNEFHQHVRAELQKIHDDKIGKK